MADLRQEGNERFKAGDFQGALALYTQAIQQIKEGMGWNDVSIDKRNEAATILTNCAACYLKLSDWESCVEVCDEALQFDSSKTKALFRRALAFRAMKNFDRAIQDAKSVLCAEPRNQEASQLLQNIRQELLQVKDSSGFSVLETKLANPWEKPDETEDILHHLLARLQDEEFARSMSQQRQLLVLIWGIATTWKEPLSCAREDNKVQATHLALVRSCVTLSLRVFTAIASHSSLVPVVASIFSFEELCDLLRDLSTHEHTRDSRESSSSSSLRTNADAFPVIALLISALVPVKPEAWQLLVVAVAPCADIGQVSTLWSERMPFAFRSVAMEAIVKLLSPLRENAEKDRYWSQRDTGAESKEVAQKIDQDYEIQYNGLSSTTLLSCGLVERLLAASDEYDHQLRPRFALVLSQLLAIVEAIRGRGPSGRETREKGENAVRQFVRNMAAPVMKASEEEKVNVEATPVEISTRLVGFVSLLFLCNRELAMWVVQNSHIVVHAARLFDIQHPSYMHFLALEFVGHMAGDDTGRNLVLPMMEDIQDLTDVGSSSVAAVAAATLAKLSGKTFDAETEEGRELMSNILTLLNSSNNESIYKGIEGLAFLIPDTDAKQRLVASTAALQKVAQIALECTELESSHAYGLAYVCSQLVINADDKKREAMWRRDIDPEQWEKLQDMAKSRSSKPMTDNQEKAAFRRSHFCALNGPSALVHLAESSSTNTRQAVAEGLCAIAIEKELRGAILAAGGLPCLLKLAEASEHNSKECRIYASHALAKICITTDPHLLPEWEVMDMVCPLLQLCKEESTLAQFEALMTLTNIASLSESTKEQIVKNKGIKTIEFLQISDNIMIRRASTEADDQDEPLQMAASGCLAMISEVCLAIHSTIYLQKFEFSCFILRHINIKDPEIAAKIIEEEGVLKFLELSHSENEGLQHRAAFALRNLAALENGKKAIEDATRAGSNLRRLSQSSNCSIREIVQEILSLDLIQ